MNNSQGSARNYFEIFSAADREMAHTAMIRELLLEDEHFYKSLFPALRKMPRENEVRCEYAPAGIHDGRLDLAILDGESIILALENKFKSFPDVAQLNKYDKSMPAGTLKCLLAFASSALNARVCAAGWHLLTYKDVLRAITAYLAANPGLLPKKAILYREYADFLTEYLCRYDQMLASPAILKQWQRENFAEINFFKRLLLGDLANRLQLKYPGLGISSNSGGAHEPLLDIFAPHWNMDMKLPIIFLQVQGDKIKFYLRWREASGSARKKRLPENMKKSIIAYLAALQPELGMDAGYVARKLEGNGASCTICAAPFDLSGDMEDLLAQIENFYLAIDEKVASLGKFC